MSEQADKPATPLPDYTPFTRGVIYATQPSHLMAHPAAAKQFYAQDVLPGSPYAGMPVIKDPYSNSLLPDAFNTHWANALNAKLGGQDITRFVMCHADVIPQSGWLGRLLEMLDRTGADVVAATIPIKDPRGLHSTALDDPDDPWEVYRRLTAKEMELLPETFTADDCLTAGLAGDPLEIKRSHPRALLPNTGCWVADFTKDWVWRFPGFRIDTRLAFNLAEDWEGEVGQLRMTGVVRAGDVIPLEHYHPGMKGVVRNQAMPEDWNFGRWLASRGCRVVCTRSFQVVHAGGDIPYNNRDTTYGQWEHDEGLRRKWDPAWREAWAAGRAPAEGNPVPDDAKVVGYEQKFLERYGNGQRQEQAAADSAGPAAGAANPPGPFGHGVVTGYDYDIG